MSTAYYNLGDFARAEELGLEVEDIFTKTLGNDHNETKKGERLLRNHSTTRCEDLGAGGEEVNNLRRAEARRCGVGEA
jgi:hypothetical protein